MRDNFYYFGGGHPVVQGEWWRGFNDASAGRAYHNIYTTTTAKNEYQLGYDAEGGAWYDRI